MNRITSLSRRQHGLAAVELAISFPFLLLLLAGALYYGRVLWHYTAAQKAAHDAVRYLSMVSEVEMTDPALAAPAAALANDIVKAEIADLNPGEYLPSITIECDGVACDGAALPSTVRVAVRMRITDPFFAFASERDGTPILADVTMRYVGTK